MHKLVVWFYFGLSFLGAGCFEKPVKPDLPPEVLSILPVSNSVYDEGAPVLFELIAQDDRLVKQIKLVVDDQILDSSRSDTLRHQYSSTQKEGRHFYYYEIRDSKNQIRLTTLSSFTVQAFEFQVQSPDADYYIADSLRLKLSSPGFEYCRWINLIHLGSTMRLESWIQPDFALDLSDLNPGLFKVKIGLLDQDSLTLDDHDYSFIKVAGPVLQLPDTTFSTSDTVYHLPMEIRMASRIYKLDFKIEYFKEYIRIVKIEMADATEQRKLSFSTTPLSSPDQMAVSYTTVPTTMLNGNTIVFILELKKGTKALTGISTILNFSNTQGNGGEVTVYGNKCKINFE